MILLGHIAAADLARRALGVRRAGALAACMFPDLIDKPVRWIGRMTPNDRIPAHTFLFWAATSGLARALLGRSFARGWFVGYGAHLACDQINALLNPGRIYPLWPFKRYDMHRGPTGLKSSLQDFSGASLALEAALTLLGLLWHLQDQAPTKRTAPEALQEG